jgi:hypothetical protein
MADRTLPKIDVVVLSRHSGPLCPEVERGLHNQRSVQIVVHRVVGQPEPSDKSRCETIARARNEGKLRGTAPWLMFVDDDVVLEPKCIRRLLDELRRRPVFGALAADYSHEHRPGEIASHVTMGATLFRREALAQIRFAARGKRCECQCCCDDLRRLLWGIDYAPAAKACHLPTGEFRKVHSAKVVAPRQLREGGANGQANPGPQAVPSICLVVCYFGPPPGWMKHYLLTCAYNPSIDFLIFTDQEQFPTVPRNVRIKQLTNSSFNELASNKLGIEIKLNHFRKLCDFKPTYGHLFEEYLEGWDYWGYTDLDVVYGDIRRFLSTARLQDYDVFTARKEFLVGHFTLLRNNHSMRTLYQQSADYRTTLQTPEMLSFSECGKQWQRRFQGKPLNDDAACDSMTHVVHRMMAERTICACFSPACIEWPGRVTPAWRLRWHAGRLSFVNRRREVMYFHFRVFKQLNGYRRPRRLESDAAFEISPKGFVPASLPINR